MNHDGALAIVLFFFCFAGQLSSEADLAAAVSTVDVHAAKELVGSDHKYLDVRTLEEFKKGYLEKSINVPYMFFTPQGREKNPKFVDQVSAICDKEDHIVVGCQSGVRSMKATADLVNAGFKHVKNMGGGYAAWVEKGFGVNTISHDTCLEAVAVLTVDVHAAKQLVAFDHKYLDVRTSEEFMKGHLKDSLNVPYMFITPQGREKNPNFVEQVLEICEKEDNIVVGCQSGVRSLKATADLLTAGFKHVKNMGGGYAAWVENGFDVNIDDEAKQ